jgi:hypothetical protein
MKPNKDVRISADWNVPFEELEKALYLNENFMGFVNDLTRQNNLISRYTRCPCVMHC